MSPAGSSLTALNDFCRFRFLDVLRQFVCFHRHIRDRFEFRFGDFLRRAFDLLTFVFERFFREMQVHGGPSIESGGASEQKTP
jgi:hypothetical protein